MLRLVDLIKLFLILSISLFSFFYNAPKATIAQDLSSIGIANYYPIIGENIKDGHIVSASNKGYFLSESPYDVSIVGVVTKTPAISISVDSQSDTFPVVSQGTSYVFVSGINGQISKGDLITSSFTPGVGMKADKSGFILGQALDDFKLENPNCPNNINGKEKVTVSDECIGKIPVTLNLRFALSDKTASTLVFKSLKEVVSLSTIATLESPSDILRYVLAAVSVLFTILIAVFTFVRHAGLGIEALGRNPRASTKIVLGITINVATSLAIISAGLIAAYFIVAPEIKGV